MLNHRTEEIIRNECNLFEPIEFCVEYDIEHIMGDSSYLCEKCDAGHYLSDNRCLVRLVQPSQCEHYDKQADKCLECEERFFINSDNSACVPFPEGITNCRIYESKTSCLACI